MTRALRTLESYRGLIRLAITVLLLLGLVVFGWSSVQGYFEVEEINLPELVGLSEAEAVARLEGLGLQAVPFDDNVADAPTGSVTSQSPLAGTVVREGRGVSIGVNTPQASVRVPDLITVQENEAAATLSELGLRLGEVRYVFSTAAEGAVLEQLPAAGNTLASGQQVDVVVSRGPDIPTVTMPELRGLSIDAAKRRLQSLGFNAVDTTATSVSFDRPLTVTDQVPLSGQGIPATTRVVLHYSLSSQTVAQVPYLMGMSLGRARALLQASGLSLGTVSYITDPAQTGGIIRYEPSDYTLSGSPVSLVLNTSGAPLDPPTLSDRPSISFPGQSANPGENVPALPQTGPGIPGRAPNATTETAPPVAPTPPVVTGQRNVPFDFDPARLGMPSLQEQAFTLKLTVADDRGERTVFEDVLSAGEPLHLDITVYGDALLQTYVNDILFLAWNP